MRITLAFPDRAALLRAFEDELSKRRAFVPGRYDVSAFTACELVLALPGGETYTLHAEIVHVRTEPPEGVGLALASLDADALAELRAFSAPEPDTDEPEDAAPPAAEHAA